MHIANLYKDKPILISGHADTIGTEDYNLRLSKKRANSVEIYLKSLNINNEIISKGFGESVPMINTGDGIVEKKNRRVEIFIQL